MNKLADISKEIQDFKTAVYGKDVRNSMVSLAEKVNTEATSAANLSRDSAASSASSAQDANTAIGIANAAKDECNTAAINANEKAVLANNAAQTANTAAAGAIDAAEAANNIAEEVESRLIAGELKGETGPEGPQGIQGEAGMPFQIAKVYPSIDNMNGGYDSDAVEVGQFVIINTDDTEDPDNAKLYIKGSSAYDFITDLSGATGMQGPQGVQGLQGPQGKTGPQGQPGDSAPEIIAARGEYDNLKTRLDVSDASVIQMIDDLTIGGRNYLQNSEFRNGLDNWEGADSSTISIDTIEDKTVLKIDKTTSTTADGTVYQSVAVSKNQTYILHGKVYVASAGRITVTIFSDAGSLFYNSFIQADAPGWYTVKCRFNTEQKTTIRAAFAVRTDEAYLYHPKLEIGNKATDWTPAPEDVQEQIQNLITSVSGKQNILQGGTYVGDLNDLKEPKRYWLRFSDNTNLPVIPNSNYGYIEIQQISSSSFLQILTTFSIDSSLSKVYYRYYTNAQWYDWAELAVARDLLFNAYMEDISSGAPFNKNFIQVEIGNPKSNYHRSSYFAKPANDGTWSNIPTGMDTTLFTGYREVLYRSTIGIEIKITEMYPVPGRIWWAYYNSGTWYMWYVTTATDAKSYVDLNALMSTTGAGRGSVLASTYKANSTGGPTQARGLVLTAGLDDGSSIQVAFSGSSGYIRGKTSGGQVGGWSTL